MDVRTYVAWKSGVFEFEKMELQQITRPSWGVGMTWNLFIPMNLYVIFYLPGAADRHRDMSIILGMIEKLSKIQFIKKDRIITVSKKWKGVRLTLLSRTPVG